MALDFVSEADQKFLADNLLSLDDWGADIKSFEGLTEDDLINDIPGLKIPDLHDVDNDGSPFTSECSDGFSTDLNGQPWESPLYSNDFLDGIMIKSEPLSPSSSSCSDLSSESVPPLLNGNIHTDSNNFDVRLESPPLTPPREDQITSIPPSIVSVPNKVAILPKPVTAHPPILPKLEPKSSSIEIKPSTVQITKTHPQTITVQQIPVTVAQPIVVRQPKNGVKVVPQNINVVNYQPPVKQSRVVTPGNDAISVPITTVLPPKDTDIKAWKRQQRMIKNRESACLSRKKKKEYLQGLEGTLQECAVENEKLKSENELLKRKILALQSENEKLRKAQARLPQTNRTTACLFALIFFVGVNIAPFSLLTSNVDPNSNIVSNAHHGRALLSFEEENTKTNDVIHNTTNIDDIIRHTLESTRNISSHRDRDSKNLMILKDMDVAAILTKNSSFCAMFNSTDTVRLVDELTGWVHGHEAELQEKKRKDQKKELRDKLFRKKRKTKTPKPKVDNPTLPDVNVDETSIQVYDYLFEKSYTRFLEALNRRDDTFYVVSFRKDHLLLPATAYNATQRPKMSLVMPAMGMNETMLKTPANHLAMMQIDCEVMNTQVVHVKHSDDDAAAARPQDDILTNMNNYNETHTDEKTHRRLKKSP
ncbi:cyclic AMP-dependent transcription factor ATF-6 alpha-like [Glandiceps talaboti]